MQRFRRQVRVPLRDFDIRVPKPCRHLEDAQRLPPRPHDEMRRAGVAHVVEPDVAPDRLPAPSRPLAIVALMVDAPAPALPHTRIAYAWLPFPLASRRVGGRRE